MGKTRKNTTQLGFKKKCINRMKTHQNPQNVCKLFANKKGFQL